MQIKVSPQTIKSELDSHVSGQEEAKRMLATAGYVHCLRYHRDHNADYLDSPPRYVPLLYGPAGSGKTTLATKLADYLKFPFSILDATTLSQGDAWHGDSIYAKLNSHMKRYRHTPYWENINYSIILIDEFDKICGVNMDSSNTNVNRGIQASLLTLIEGNLIELADFKNVDTRKMLFILGGSFAAVQETANLEKSEIGFNQELKDINTPKILTLKQFNEHGMITEIISRVGPISRTIKLSKDEIKHALSLVYNSIISQYESLFLLGSSKLELTDSDYEKIIDTIHKSEYGMRYARTILFEYLQHKIFELSTLLNVEEVTVEKEVVIHE